MHNYELRKFLQRIKYYLDQKLDKLEQFKEDELYFQLEVEKDKETQLVIEKGSLEDWRNIVKRKLQIMEPYSEVRFNLHRRKSDDLIYHERFTAVHDNSGGYGGFGEIRQANMALPGNHDYLDVIQSRVNESLRKSEEQRQMRNMNEKLLEQDETIDFLERKIKSLKAEIDKKDDEIADFNKRLSLQGSLPQYATIAGKLMNLLGIKSEKIGEALSGLMDDDEEDNKQDDHDTDDDFIEEVSEKSTDLEKYRKKLENKLFAYLKNVELKTLANIFYILSDGEQEPELYPFIRQQIAKLNELRKKKKQESKKQEKEEEDDENDDFICHGPVKSKGKVEDKAEVEVENEDEDEDENEDDGYDSEYDLREVTNDDETL